MSKPILGYWDARGFGQPIRLLLTYLNVDFEDKRYEMSKEGFDSWFGKKFDMGFDFPNVSFPNDFRSF